MGNYPLHYGTEAHKAEMIALYKKGNRADLDNYRGIVKLSIISRLVAKIISMRLIDHAEENKIFRDDRLRSASHTARALGWNPSHGRAMATAGYGLLRTATACYGCLFVSVTNSGHVLK